MAEREIGAMAGTAREVRAHLDAHLVTVGDLWLPTRAELRRWHESGAPLYVSWTRGGGFEIGARLETIPAARFAPAIRGRLVPGDDGRTRLVGRVVFPRSTLVVLALFAVMVAGWGVVTWTRFAAGETHAGWVGAWAVTALVTSVAPAIAYVAGRPELERELAHLRRVLDEAPHADEEW
jgi:hypothetical protein